MTDAQNELREFLICSAGKADILDTLIKAITAGDVVLKVTPATIALAATEAAWTKTVKITAETAAGEVHRWCNWKVNLAIADTSTAGAAAISPAAGDHALVDGELEVTISGSAAAWLAAETATLTVNSADQDPAGGTTDYTILGKSVAAKTCVVTVA